MSEDATVTSGNTFTVNTYHPWDVISMDCLTRLPPSTQGYTGLLVIIDNFTRFVELHPIKTPSESEVLRGLLEHIGRYGIPAKVITDLGREFVANVIEELIQVLGIDHIRTMAYAKEENSMVERAYKETLRDLQVLVYDHRVLSEWKTYYPLVQRIINAAVHSATGETPAHLLFAAGVNLDRGIFEHLPEIDANSIQSLSAYVQALVQTERMILDLSQEHQEGVAAANMEARIHGPPTEFPIGSYVMVRYPETRMGRKAPTKLHMPLKGPFRVIRISPDGNKYDVLNLVNHEEYRFPVNRLVKFIVDERNEDPFEIAMRDHQEFEVERILDHRGTVRERRNLRFLVKWANYPDDESTWEPYEALREVAALHDYLTTHYMKALIPRRFRYDLD
jgi:hypothetical protein